jgi:D-alanyl-D-alanine-carboxypeptidase/D-alanyl-D-alanine-endopeptidase
MKQIIDAKGSVNLEDSYADLKKNEANTYNFSESQLNQLGYHYLGNGKIENAVATFKLNADLFPKSSNVYDSYGEALLASGETEKAIENYLKAVELNPGSTEGIKILKDLGVDTEGLFKKIAVADTILQTYVGNYELAPEFIISISKKGSLLMAQATGQSEFEIYPKSETVFYLKVVEAQVTFNLNEDGQVASMTLLQGGQETTGLKLKD